MTTHTPKSTARAKRASTSVAGFFLVDKRRIETLATLPDALETTATYLALAKNTDASNVISRGGRKSIQNYTGLSRREADVAIQTLANAGLIQRLPIENIRNPVADRFALPRSATDEDVSSTFSIANGFVSSESGTSPLCRIVALRDFDLLTLALTLMQREDATAGQPLPPEFAQLKLAAESRDDDLGHVRLRQFATRPRDVATEDASLMDAMDNLATLEALKIVEWVIYPTALRRADPSPLTSYPLAVVRHGLPALDGPEAKLGLISHLLLQLYDGAAPASLDELKTSWSKSRMITSVTPTPAQVTGAVGLLRLSYPVDPRGLLASERADHCRHLAEDLAELVHGFFPTATELAETVLDGE